MLHRPRQVSGRLSSYGSLPLPVPTGSSPSHCQRVVARGPAGPAAAAAVLDSAASDWNMPPGLRRPGSDIVDQMRTLFPQQPHGPPVRVHSTYPPPGPSLRALVLQPLILRPGPLVRTLGSGPNLFPQLPTGQERGCTPYLNHTVREQFPRPLHRGDAAAAIPIRVPSTCSSPRRAGPLLRASVRQSLWLRPGPPVRVLGSGPACGAGDHDNRNSQSLVLVLSLRQALSSMSTASVSRLKPGPT